MAWGRGRSGLRARATADPALLARLGPGERLLAAAPVRSSGGNLDETSAQVVGGTARSLYLPDGVVLGWHEVDQAVWNHEDSTLDLVTLPIDGPARSYRIRLAEPGRLPELVRERVTSSIVVNQHVPMVGRSGAKIIARRLHGRDELEWVVVYDAGIDGDDVEIKQRVRDALAVLRRDLGV